MKRLMELTPVRRFSQYMSRLRAPGSLPLMPTIAIAWVSLLSFTVCLLQDGAPGAPG